MEISNWFKGFEKGIARLSPEERSAFFSECGKNCVNGGTLSVYKKLYENAKGNMDVFFQMANDLPGVKGEVVEKGHVYLLIFLKCTCELCKKGYVTTPLLCECSRQSVIYSLRSLWKDKNFTVTLCHSILGGGTYCEIRIEVDRIDEANSGSPVYVANRIVSAFTLGGCNDYALLVALRDGWLD